MLSNRQLSELLAVAAGQEQRGSNRQRAMARAASAALFSWPEEASELMARDAPLTDLPSVGPWVAAVLGGWLALPAPPEPPDPPPLRAGFLSLAEARRAVEEHPDWGRGLRADLQMHTTYSDGRATLSEMVEASERRGYEYVALTDHSKGLKIAGGMDEAELEGQGREIDNLNTYSRSRGSTTALKGLEMNLSPEGEGDMDETALGRLDFVLGAFHSKLRVTEDQTARYLAALRNPTFHVLAHPRGRRFNVRLGLSAEWDVVVREAVEHGKALEIDAYPDRQDLDVEVLGLARQADVWISIGSDAHSVGELAFMEFGLAAAIRAGIRRERILNFLPREELFAWARRATG